MFGFGNKRAKAVDEAERYIRSMLFGLVDAEGKPLPNRAFADPYVVGFLQVLTVHAVAVVYRFRMPDEAAITDIMAKTLDRMAPGYGAMARQGIAEFGNPAHPQHETYLSGRHEGSEHVRTLFTADGIARNERHRSFRDFVQKHYL